MLNVYISHLGEKPLYGINEPLTCSPGTLQEILEQIEALYPGFWELMVDAEKNKLRSSTLVYKNIEVDYEGRWLEGQTTEPLTRLDGLISNSDSNLLIALFNPDRLMTVLTEALSATEARLEHANGTNSYRAFMSGPDDTLGNQVLWCRSEPNALYPFRNGRIISELVTDDLISLAQDKLVPARLRDAIANLWELDNDFQLRLFQEEALLHILHELRASVASERHPLLLSIPTGGGKTEAFLIPLIAHLYDRKLAALQAGSPLRNNIRTLILYPTRALANDQAKRVAEILYALNLGLVEGNKITVGVLTGDTPNSSMGLGVEKSLLQVCPACSAVLANFPSRQISESVKLSYARCSCGAEIDFFRLTRWDIINAPPDILITSPDMINRALQSPRLYHTLFSEAIESVVFDEIHMYEGVFGCNVAHLLRRFEDACGHHPLYIGVSATIRNAKALASLIFDADLEAVRYLRPAPQSAPTTTEERPYIDYDAPPSRYRYSYAVTPARIKAQQFQKTVTATRNIAAVIGHIIHDPHFRKTLIFANFRQDTDDIVRFLRDQEARYHIPYMTHILPKLLSALQATDTTADVDLTTAEVDIARAVDYWYRHALEIGALYTPPLEIGWHRGGLEKEERIKAVNRFTAARRLRGSGEESDEWPIDVLAATKTLELGIDIGDVTTVINNTAPFSVNEYTQRVGRGGRRRDSLALTVVDPTNPLDFYFLRHFDHYAHPTAEDFEDAPIIISNQDILRSHLYARLLDFLARYGDDQSKSDLQAIDLKNYRVVVNGQAISLGADWETFANAIFDIALPPTTISRLRAWILREASVIPGVQPTDITEESLRGWWLDKLRSLYERIYTRRSDIADTDYISGMEPRDRDLVPDMRSAGPQVGVYLVREKGDDELRDTLARSQAIASRPVGGFASQGSVTFRVEDVKTRDMETERNIKRFFGGNPVAAETAVYFARMFGDENQESPFPEAPLDILTEVEFVTPRDLSVKYYPYRFYCPRCGATYSDKRGGDEHCSICGSELRQLTEVYVCGGCGNVEPPPIPKVCINPSCVAKAKHSRDGTPFTEAVRKIGRYDQHNNYFRFTALPRLKWQCRDCGTEINYHAYYELPQPVLSQLNNAGWNADTPPDIAKRFLYYPESNYRKNYDSEGWHGAHFTCKDCKNANTYHRIHVTNIPTHHSVVHEYIIHNESYAPLLDVSLGKWEFDRVSVIALAWKKYRRYFSYPDQESMILPENVFPDTNKYLANLYDTHAAFLKLSTAVEAFLDKHPLAQDYIQGHKDVCRSQRPAGAYDEEDQDIENSEMTSPIAALLPWEKNRKPDPRRMWCDIARGTVPGTVCMDDACSVCRLHAFDRRQFVRYLVIHTVKHALINVMPRYTGVNKNQIRGYIYPNDQREYDLALVDRIVGGSGCLYLLRTNWDAVWEMIGELLDAAQQDQGQLLLPYTCSRYNRDLCAPLAYAFYEFVRSGNI